MAVSPGQRCASVSECCGVRRTLSRLFPGCEESQAAVAWCRSAVVTNPWRSKVCITSLSLASACEGSVSQTVTVLVNSPYATTSAPISCRARSASSALLVASVVSTRVPCEDILSASRARNPRSCPIQAPCVLRKSPAWTCFSSPTHRVHQRYSTLAASSARTIPTVDLAGYARTEHVRTCQSPSWGYHPPSQGVSQSCTSISVRLARAATSCQRSETQLCK